MKSTPWPLIATTSVYKTPQSGRRDVPKPHDILQTLIEHTEKVQQPPVALTFRPHRGWDERCSARSVRQSAARDALRRDLRLPHLAGSGFDRPRPRVCLPPAGAGRAG